MYPSKKRTPTLKSYMQSSKICFMQKFPDDTEKGKTKNRQLGLFLTAYHTRIIAVKSIDKRTKEEKEYLGIIDINHDEKFEEIMFEATDLFHIHSYIMVKSAGRFITEIIPSVSEIPISGEWIDDNNLEFLYRNCNFTLQYTGSTYFYKIMSPKQNEMFKHPVIDY